MQYYSAECDLGQLGIIETVTLTLTVIPLPSLLNEKQR